MEKKTAKTLRKNLFTGSDSDSSSDCNELDLSKRAKWKTKTAKVRNTHRTDPECQYHTISPHSRLTLGLNSVKTYDHLYKEANHFFESDTKLPTSLEQLGEFLPIFIANFFDHHCTEKFDSYENYNTFLRESPLWSGASVSMIYFRKCMNH